MRLNVSVALQTNRKIIFISSRSEKMGGGKHHGCTTVVLRINSIKTCSDSNIRANRVYLLPSQLNKNKMAGLKSSDPITEFKDY